MRHLGLAPICPNDRALLLIKIKQSGFDTGSDGEVHGNCSFADPSLLGNERYDLHNCTPS